MNPYLKSLHPYPFERLNALLQGHQPSAHHEPVSLALGEPKHGAPDFIVQALQEKATIAHGLATYPPTRGAPEIRQAISSWLKRRFAVDVCPDREILPVNGTREALFSFGQAVLSGHPDSRVVLPNPCYQIYEGSALLRGATPYYLPSTITPDFRSVPDAVWEATELLYLCSPSNPSGAVIPREDLRYVVELSQEFGFTIAADECYSEIYFDESSPPLGMLQVANEMGLDSFKNCVVFHSLSKRSSCPGLRSGFVAGDASIMEKYYEYRTYHGCAMPAHVQSVSIQAWDDEQHVVANRALYREKFDSVKDMVADSLGCQRPDGAFYYWPDIGMSDEEFAIQLYEREGITVLPGSYLGRESNGVNPGSNRIRIALVGPHADCVDSISRLCSTARELAT